MMTEDEQVVLASLRGPKADAYREEIMPLIKQLMEISAKHKISWLANFALDDSLAGTVSFEGAENTPPKYHLILSILNTDDAHIQVEAIPLPLPQIPFPELAQWMHNDHGGH